MKRRQSEAKGLEIRRGHWVTVVGKGAMPWFGSNCDQKHNESTVDHPAANAPAKEGEAIRVWTISHTQLRP
jgi:hypothetical protein